MKRSPLMLKSKIMKWNRPTSKSSFCGTDAEGLCFAGTLHPSSLPDTNALCVLMRHMNCDKLLLSDEQGSESRLPLLIQNRITDTFSLPYYKKYVTKFIIVINDKYFFEVSLIHIFPAVNVTVYTWAAHVNLTYEFCQNLYCWLMEILSHVMVLSVILHLSLDVLFF